MDYFRRQSRQSEEIPLSSFETDDNEDGVLQKIESKEAHTVLQIQEETEQRREEIFRLDQLLSHYGIRFSELVKISPKHQDARDRALQVARTLISDPELLGYLTRKKSLPLKDLEAKVKSKPQDAGAAEEVHNYPGPNFDWRFLPSTGIPEPTGVRRRWTEGET